MNGISLCGLTRDEIIEVVKPSFNITVHQATIIANQIYKKKVTDFLLINSIPSALREVLKDNFSAGTFSPVGSIKSNDRSVKFLFNNKEGMAYETVFIPENKRNTVCVSTQSGCRMGCPFCATGRLGFHGNLTSGEIINQVLSLPISEKVSHVVFMGMGEPMDNLINVLKACEILTAEWGPSISPRNITVSTVGILPEMKRFLETTNCNLVLSLFSPFPGERRKIIPVAGVNELEEMLDLIKNFPVKKKRRLSVAYVMINGINDTDKHLEALKAEFSGSRIRINLLPYHPLPTDSLESSSPEKIQHFKHELIISGISASIRKSRGADISAACGLLAVKGKNGVI